MPDVSSMAGTAAAVAEAVVPGVAPFEPLISLVLTAIRAHYNASQTWPTEAQVLAALPADYLTLQNTWAAWTAAHPGV
jgi:hypothetical protein